MYTNNTTPEERLAQSGIELPTDVKASGTFELAIRRDDTLYLSGQIPRKGGSVMFEGKVGDEVALEDAKEAARICAVRLLAIIRNALGSLDDVERMLQVNVFVNSSPDFTDPTTVADGASAIFHEILGPRGKHTRTAVCVNQLPRGACVEINAVLASKRPSKSRRVGRA